MKQNDVISIIVPVYNVETYLCRCIDSVLAQTFKNFELLLVDDGSTDNSGKICDEYAQKDCRIKVLHKPNGGVSSARNLGIKNASGKYISFIDSDDTVEPEFLQVLHERMQTHGTKLSVCNYKLIDHNGDETRESVIHDCRYLVSECNMDFLVLIILTVWNKMFLTDLIRTNNVIFHEDITSGEDGMFIIQYIHSLHKQDVITTISTSPYLYTMSTPNSLTKKIHRE